MVFALSVSKKGYFPAFLYVSNGTAFINLNKILKMVLFNKLKNSLLVSKVSNKTKIKPSKPLNISIQF